MTEPTQAAGEASLRLLQTLLNQIPTGLVLIGRDGKCHVNDIAGVLLGKSEGVLAAGLTQIKALAAANQAGSIEVGTPGAPRLIRAEPRRCENEAVSWIVGLTEAWRAMPEQQVRARWEEETQAELQAYKAALDQHAIVGTTDRGGRITYVNRAFCEISQYCSDELIGRTHAIVNSGYHPRSFFTQMWRTIGNGNRWRGEVCNRAKDGSLYWVDTTIAPRRNAAGAVEGYVSIRFDISERKRAEAELEAENQRRRGAETLLRDVIETVPDGIAAFDRDDRLLLFNEAYRRFYPEIGDSIALGQPFETLLRQGVTRGQFALGRELARDPEGWIESRLRQHRRPGRTSVQHLSDGRWLQVQERVSPSGNIVGVRTDITALKQAEQLIKNQAERDPLTGLYNRSVLYEQLNRQVERSTRSGIPGALVVVDLDGFKDINDTLGHDAGDVLLESIGRRLGAALRASDIEVRLGGDEFALILPRVADARTVERLVARLYETLEAPLDLGRRRIRPAASMGVCMFPRDGTDPAELLKNADIALYQAKARGRGRHCFFSIHLRDRLERREALADDLRLGLERDEIGIALQPQVAAASGEHVGFEALARWSRNGAEIPPSQFVPVAEETDLIVPLGRRVLERALGEIALMRTKGLRPGPVAVNVAAAQLKLPEFADNIAGLLLVNGLSPADLEIEVTETVLLDRSAEQIARGLEALHEMGVSIALDDFGTGHASLSHLKRFPVDRLKIDRSFVSGIGTDIEDEVIVKAVINLAQSLGKTVVAEGVETEAQLEFLTALHCDIIQGYLVSPPLMPAAARRFLADRAKADEAA